MFLTRAVRGAGLASAVLLRTSVRSAAAAGTQQQAARLSAPSCRFLSLSGTSKDNDDFEAFQKMLSEAGAQPQVAAAAAEPAENNDSGAGDAVPSAPAEAAVGDDSDDANPTTTTASSFLNSINAQGASHEEEEEDFRSALEEEVERIVAQRTEYFEVLQKAAAGRLSDEAIQLVGNMRALNIPLDADVYNAAMAACMDDIERFDQLRSEMRQDKIPTNASSLVITTNVCESNSMFEEAFLVQKDLLNLVSRIPKATVHTKLTEAKLQLASFNVPLTSSMFYSLITSELAQGNVRRAYLYVVEMAEAGTKFAHVTGELVYRACQEAGFAREAQHLESIVTPELLFGDYNESHASHDGSESGQHSSDDDDDLGFYEFMAEFDAKKKRDAEKQL